MWNDLTHMDLTLVEKVIRTVVVYVALAVLLRLAGKRDLAQLNAFDLVVMLLLSNVVQNAIIGPDNSLVGGLVGAVVLVGINAVIVRASRSDDRLNRLLEGTPTVLARDGAWDEQALRREGLRHADAEVALRRGPRRTAAGHPRGSRPARGQGRSAPRGWPLADQVSTVPGAGARRRSRPGCRHRRPAIR
jgi:hypothetical protein